MSGKRPEPPRSSVLTLSALFLLACTAFGVQSVYPEFGSTHYDTNVLLRPPAPNMQRTLGPMEVTKDNMELIFFAYHLWPPDMPDRFVFDWRLVSLDGDLAAEGQIDYDGADYREHPDVPTGVRVPLEVAFGEYLLVIEPQGLGAYPDLIILLSWISPVPNVALVLSALFGAMFIALLIIVVRRHRAALGAWRSARQAGPGAVAAE